MAVLQPVLDVIGALLLLAGGFFVLVAGIGMLRFKNVYMRMHSAGKPATLGLALVAVGAMMKLPAGPAAKLAIVIFLQFLTVSVGAHLMSRSAHMSGVRLAGTSGDDDLQDLEPGAAQIGPSLTE